MRHIVLILAMTIGLAASASAQEASDPLTEASAIAQAVDETLERTAATLETVLAEGPLQGTPSIQVLQGISLPVYNLSATPALLSREQRVTLNRDKRLFAYQPDPRPEVLIAVQQSLYRRALVRLPIRTLSQAISRRHPQAVLVAGGEASNGDLNAEARAIAATLAGSEPATASVAGTDLAYAPTRVTQLGVLVHRPSVPVAETVPTLAPSPTVSPTEAPAPIAPGAVKSPSPTPTRPTGVPWGTVAGGAAAGILIGLIFGLLVGRQSARTAQPRFFAPPAIADELVGRASSLRENLGMISVGLGELQGSGSAERLHELAARLGTESPFPELKQRLTAIALAAGELPNSQELREAVGRALTVAEAWHRQADLGAVAAELRTLANRLDGPAVEELRTRLDQAKIDAQALRDKAMQLERAIEG